MVMCARASGVMSDRFFILVRTAVLTGGGGGGSRQLERGQLERTGEMGCWSLRGAFRIGFGLVPEVRDEHFNWER